MEADGAAPNLTALRERRSVLRLQSQIKQLERTQKLTESVWWDGGFSGTDMYRNSFGDTNGWLPVGGIGVNNLSDRQRGDNGLLFRTEAQLGMLRTQGRIICSTNSYAIGLLSGLTSYVIGTGFTYRITTKDSAHDDLVAKAQDVVDEFLEINEWNELEAELFWRSREDGEYFLRHFAVDDGRTEVRTVEPEQVRNPPGVTQEEGWTYGMRHATKPTDVQQIEEYHVADLEQVGEGEYLDPKEMLHLKINGKRSIKRGLTDFCFATADAFEVASRLRRAIGEGAAVQASTAEIWQHSTATQAQVSALTGGQTDWTRDHEYPAATRRNAYQKLEPGTIRHIPSGMQLATLPGAAGQGAWAGYTEALQAVLRAAGVRWNAPEWLASGLHDTSSFASSLTAESPFVISVKKMQEFYAQRFKKSVIIALNNAIEVGRLPEGCMKVLEVQVEAPPIETRDPLKEAQVDGAYVQMGVKSVQTVTQELGLDYEQEQVNREEYQERTGGQGQGLDMPPDQPPGQGPAGVPPGAPPPGGSQGGPKKPPMPGGQKPQGPPAATPESLRESIAPVTLDDFPYVRQTEDFSCGAAVMAAVLTYLGIPEDEQDEIAELGSNAADGTRPEHLVAAGIRHGLECLARSRMTIDELWREIEKGRPVVVALQRWGGGHYVSIVGYDSDQVYLMDPVDGLDRMDITAFDAAWTDTDADGNEADHVGLSFWRPGAVSESKDPSGHEHKDKGEGGGQFTGGGGGGGTAPKADRIARRKLVRAVDKAGDRLHDSYFDADIDGVDSLFPGKMEELIAAVNEVYAPFEDDPEARRQPAKTVAKIASHVSGQLSSMPLETTGYEDEAERHAAVAGFRRVGADALKVVQTLDAVKGHVRESKDSSGHEHKGKGEGGGQFAAGSGGGTATAGKPAGDVKPSGPFASIKATAADVKDAAVKVGQAAWDKLPAGVQSKLAKTYAVGKAIEHKVMIGFEKTKALAVATAKARGLDPAYCDKVGRVLGRVDVGLAWTVSGPATFAATGSVTATKIATWVPVASLGYIAYSGSILGASKAVGKAKKLLSRGKVKEAIEEALRRGDVDGSERLQRLLESYDEDEKRDDSGKWTSGGGHSGNSSSTPVDKPSTTADNTPVGGSGHKPQGKPMDATVAKQPHEMTKEEVLAELPAGTDPVKKIRAGMAHWDAIHAHLKAGGQVAPEVLAGHPSSHAYYVVQQAMKNEPKPQVLKEVPVVAGRKEIKVSVPPAHEAKPLADGSLRLRRAQHSGTGGFQEYGPGSVIQANGQDMIVTKAKKPYTARHDGSAQGYFQEVQARPLSEAERRAADRIKASQTADKLWLRLRDQSSIWSTPEDASKQIDEYRAALTTARGGQ